MKNSDGQRALFAGKSGKEERSLCDSGPSKDRWLGLSTNQRRLFAALQDGWLRPLEKNAGLLLGAETYFPEKHGGGKHPISVCMKFDVRKLPRLDVLALPYTHK